MEILLFYTEGCMEAGAEVNAICQALVSSEKIKICRTLQRLMLHLRTLHQSALGLFLTASRGELSDILSIKYLLNNIHIILLLPDGKQETVLLAHRLRPRYLGYLDMDFSKLPSLLQKMINIYNQEEENNGKRKIAK